MVAEEDYIWSCYKLILRTLVVLRSDTTWEVIISYAWDQYETVFDHAYIKLIWQEIKGIQVIKAKFYIFFHQVINRLCSNFRQYELDINPYISSYSYYYGAQWIILSTYISLPYRLKGQCTSLMYACISLLSSNQVQVSILLNLHKFTTANLKPVQTTGAHERFMVNLRVHIWKMCILDLQTKARRASLIKQRNPHTAWNNYHNGWNA